MQQSNTKNSPFREKQINKNKQKNPTKRHKKPSKNPQAENPPEIPYVDLYYSKSKSDLQKDAFA